MSCLNPTRWRFLFSICKRPNPPHRDRSFELHFLCSWLLSDRYARQSLRFFPFPQPCADASDVGLTSRQISVPAPAIAFRCGTKVMFPRDGAWSGRSTAPVGHTQGCSPCEPVFVIRQCGKVFPGGYPDRTRLLERVGRREETKGPSFPALTADAAGGEAGNVL